ncbi:MAG: hypothetical protein ACREP9_15910, partial [Candidatus Dormibacteraceae bacterium]
PLGPLYASPPKVSFSLPHLLERHSWLAVSDIGRTLDRVQDSDPPLSLPQLPLLPKVPSGGTTAGGQLVFSGLCALTGGLLPLLLPVGRRRPTLLSRWRSVKLVALIERPG